MRNIKQGIRSTKVKKEATQVSINGKEMITVPLKKHHDIYVRIDNNREPFTLTKQGLSQHDQGMEADTS